MRNDYIVGKLYTSFAMVAIIAAVGTTVGVLIDNIIVGQFYGQLCVGAMGVVGPIALVLTALGSISADGGTALSSQALGRGDTKRLRGIFSMAVYFAVASGAIITIVGLMFTEPIARLLGAEGELLAPAADYLRGIFPGAIPMLLSLMLANFVKLDGSANLPVVMVGVMTGVNVVLDLLVVLAFDGGMLGMAVATTISYCCALAIGLTHFRKERATLRLVRPNDGLKDLAAMAGTGAPTALNRVFSTIQVAGINNLLVTAAGVGAVAAMNARTQANNFFGAVTLGLAIACVPLIGMFYGEGDRGALRATVRITLIRGLLINAALAIAIYFIAPLFVSLMGLKEPETADMAVTAARIFGLTMPFTLTNAVFISLYQGTRKTLLASVLCALQRLAFPLLFSVLLLPVMGALGVWIAYLLAEVFTLIAIVLIAAMRNHRFPTKIDDFLLVAGDFDVESGDRADFSIGNSMDDVMRLSQAIYDVGRARGINPRTLTIMALAIEEIAGNIVRHAFRPGEKRWFDVLILNRPDKIVMRLRDNGAPFAPVDYARSHQEDGAGALGLRMMMRLTDRMEYVRLLGLLNNLYIEINKQNLSPATPSEESGEGKARNV